MLRRLKYVLFFFILLVSGCSPKREYKIGINNKVFNGFETLFYLPENYQESDKLIYLLHPGYSGGKEFFYASEIKKYADEINAIVLAPSQLKSKSNRYWTWYNKINQNGEGEVKLLNEIPSMLEDLIGINFSKKYLLGFSAGACQAINIYFTHNSSYDGVCSVAGLPYGVVNNGLQGMVLMDEGEIRSEYSYNPKFYENLEIKNLNVLILHGNIDETVNSKNSEILFNQVDEMIDYQDDKIINNSNLFTINSEDGFTLKKSINNSNQVVFYEFENVSHKYGSDFLNWYTSGGLSYSKLFTDIIINGDKN